MASILPTNRCNLRCPHCGRWERPGPELPSKQWKRIIEELADAGCKRLSVSGGEPLLYADLDTLLSTANSKGLRINLNTNGILLPAKQDTIAFCKSVTLSLDGTESEHDAIRGQGTYQAAMTAAQLVRRMEKNLIFYTVLSRRNLDVLKDVVHIATDMGGTVFFQPGTYKDFDGLKRNPEAPDVDQYRKAIDRLIALKDSGFRIGNSTSGLGYIRRWPDTAPLPCYGGLLFIRIESDGNLRLCGRDGLTSRISVTGGLYQALEQLPLARCLSCWSAARVEFNLAARGDLGAVTNIVRR